MQLMLNFVDKGYLDFEDEEIEMIKYFCFVINLIGLIIGIVDGKLWLLLICGTGIVCCLAWIVERD